MSIFISYNKSGTYISNKPGTPARPDCICLQSKNSKKLIAIPQTAGNSFNVFSKGNMSRTAQPIKFNIPNQIDCAGMITKVINEIRSPKRLNITPRRKFFSFPHTHTKPETKMNVQHIICCQIWIAGRLYHVGHFAYTI